MNLYALAQAMEASVFDEASCPWDFEISGVCTDSRRVRPGDVFFALRGEKFDGHDFLKAVTEAGAAALVVETPEASLSIPQLVVSDTTRAYGEGASAWARQFPTCQTLAVVGSNGKTTTTQLLGRLLKAEFGEDAVLVTEGNFNNSIGVAHMLWSLRPTHTHAVLEAGISHPGEMAELAPWIAPDGVLITNAQREHQAYLNSVEVTAYENGMMILALPPETGLVVYPFEDPGAGIWRSYSAVHGVRSLGYVCLTPEEPKPLALIESDKVAGVLMDAPEGSMIQYAGAGHEFSWPFHLAGKHYAHDMVGAVTMALAVGVREGTVQKAMAEVCPLPGRGVSFLCQDGALRVIDEAYNANPDSMAAAMRALKTVWGARYPEASLTFVMGDMAELGELSGPYHEEMGELAHELGLTLWTYGEMSRLAQAAYGHGGRHFTDREALAQAILALTGVVMIKSSHSTGLYQLVATLKAKAS